MLHTVLVMRLYLGSLGQWHSLQTAELAPAINILTDVGAMRRRCGTSDPVRIMPGTCMRQHPNFLPSFRLGVICLWRFFMRRSSVACFSKACCSCNIADIKEGPVFARSGAFTCA